MTLKCILSIKKGGFSQPTQYIQYNTKIFVFKLNWPFYLASSEHDNICKLCNVNIVYTVCILCAERGGERERERGREVQYKHKRRNMKHISRHRPCPCVQLL